MKDKSTTSEEERRTGSSSAVSVSLLDPLFGELKLLPLSDAFDG